MNVCWFRGAWIVSACLRGVAAKGGGQGVGRSSTIFRALVLIRAMCKSSRLGRALPMIYLAVRTDVKATGLSFNSIVASFLGTGMMVDCFKQERTSHSSKSFSSLNFWGFILNRENCMPAMIPRNNKHIFLLYLLMNPQTRALFIICRMVCCVAETQACS